LASFGQVWFVTPLKIFLINKNGKSFALFKKKGTHGAAQITDQRRSPEQLSTNFQFGETNGIADSFFEIGGIKDSILQD
jgi:hypothetical protein